MTAFRLLAPAVAGLAVAASGCGTFTNFNRGYSPEKPFGREVFGGVRADFELATGQDSDPGAAFLGVADIPFSFAADLATLPWTIRAARQRRRLAAGQPSPSPQ